MLNLAIKPFLKYRSGRVCYEVKIRNHSKVDIKDFTDINVVRVGWSTDSATLQLGEDKQSYGYGGTAMKSEDRKFIAYGREYSKGINKISLIYINIIVFQFITKI